VDHRLVQHGLPHGSGGRLHSLAGGPHLRLHQGSAGARPGCGW
jgi:hypothetical protein